MDRENILPLLSVIVPVYKVEKYLDRCVESILSQTYNNLEIILVDDGSPDRCPEMCDEWSKKDSRIKVIHKENGGGAAARNVGLESATGDIITFVDSDDYLSSEMYRVLVTLLTENNADIAECDYVYTESEDHPLDLNKTESFKEYSPSEAMLEHIKDGIFRQSVVNKVYRKEILENVRFTEGKVIDDEFFTYLAIGNAKKLIHTDRIMYAYRQQQGSVMHRPYSISRLTAIEAKVLRIEYLEERFPEAVQIAKLNLWFTCMYNGQKSLYCLEGKEKKQALEYIKSVVKNYHLQKEDKKALSAQYKVWAFISAISFSMTCRLRNLLKIGN